MDQRLLMEFFLVGHLLLAAVQNQAPQQVQEQVGELCYFFRRDDGEFSGAAGSCVAWTRGSGYFAVTPWKSNTSGSCIRKGPARTAPSKEAR